jgi:hypothetical protein
MEKHAGDHGEGGHRAVDAAIDPIAQVADARPELEPLGDFVRVVVVLEMPGVHELLLRCLGYVAWAGRAGNGHSRNCEAVARIGS